MKKSITSALALTAILASGVAYAITAVNPEYAEIKLVSSTPAEGATLPGLYQGDVISITPENFADYPDMYVMYDLECDESGDWENLKNAWLNRDDENGCYSNEMYGNFDFYEGVNYRLVYTIFEEETDYYYQNAPLGQAIVNLKGSTSMYHNSPYVLESITPEDSGNDVYSSTGLLTNDTPYLALTFSGPVTIDEAGKLLGSGAGIESFGTIEAVGETTNVGNTVYAKEWHLNFRNGFLASQIAPMIITIIASDEEGRIVKGNVGEKAGSYFQYYYNVEGMYKEMQYNFGETPVTAVKDIKVTFRNMPLNPSYATADVPTITLDGEVVATVIDCQPIFPPDSDPDDFDSSTGVQLFLNKLLTVPGTYTFNMPTGYLAMGEQFDGYYQKGGEYQFTIVAGSSADVIPAPGEVKELSYFDIQYDVDGELGIDSSAGLPYLYSERENTPNSKFTSVTAMGNTLSINLFAPITDADNYTLVIPTGFLIVNGEPLPGFNAQYTIKGSATPPVTDYPAVFDPAAGPIEALPYVVNITFPAYTSANYGGGTATLSCFAGELELPEAEWGAKDNEMIQELPEDFQGIDIEGTYTITFPAGYFSLGEDNVDSPEMTLVYTIGDVPGDYPAVFTPAPGELTQLPEQIDIVFPDYNMVGFSGGIATIQFNDGDPEDLPDGSYDMEQDANCCFQPLGDFAWLAIDGTVTITFPEGYFNLDGTASPEMVIVYTNGGNLDDPIVLESLNMEWDPEPGVIKQLPDDIAFLFVDYPDTSWWCGNETRATIQFNDEEPVELEWADWNMEDGASPAEGLQPLGEFAQKSEPGTYTIIFPEGYFLVGDNYDYSPEIEIVYTIEGVTPVVARPTVDPVDGSELTALPAFITLTFASEWIHDENAEAEATIQFNNNTPVELEYEKDYSLSALLYQQQLGEFAGATGEGTYTIVFPEGYFLMGSWANFAAAVPVPAMKVVYTVENGTGVSLVGIESDRYLVYNPAGVLVLDTKNADDLKALKGLYIVNGIKVVLK